MNTIYDMAYGGLYSRYDFYDPKATRGPNDYPYNFDTYYTWRPTEKYNNTIYSDRMREWDYEKAKLAFSMGGSLMGMAPEQARRVIHTYYDGRAECVGYAVSCNQSSGYPIGVFFVRDLV